MVSWIYTFALALTLLQGIRLPGDVAFSDVILAISLSIYYLINPALQLGSAHATDSGLRLVFLGIVIYCVGVVITGVYRDTLADAIYIISQYLFLLAWFFAAANLATSLDIIKLFAAAVVMSATLSSGVALLQSMGVLGAYGAQLEGRMIGLARHPNELGLASAYAMALAFGMWLFEPHVSPYRKYWLAGCVASILGVVLSASISAIGSIIAASIFALYSYLRIFGAAAILPILYRLAALALFSCTAVTIGIVMNYIDLYDDNFIFNRLIRIGDTDADYNTATIRYEGYNNALEYITASPIIGAGGSGGESDIGDQIHNIFLKAWMDSGLFAFLGIAIVLLGVLISMRVGFHRINNEPVRGILVGTYGGIITFLVGAQTSPLSTQRSAWIAIVMLMSATSIIWSTNLTAIDRQED